MSDYTIGIDMADGNDQTAVVICKLRNIRWYHRLLKRLGLRKHLATIEVMGSYMLYPSKGVRRKCAKSK